MEIYSIIIIYTPTVLFISISVLLVAPYSDQYIQYGNRLYWILDGLNELCKGPSMPDLIPIFEPAKGNFNTPLGMLNGPNIPDSKHIYNNFIGPANNIYNTRFI